jgi:thiamine pyrophosphokinase
LNKFYDSKGIFMRAIIFANGTLNKWPSGLEISSARDLIIAADGGSHHCLAWNVTPHVVVGDMDSLRPDTLADLRSRGVEIKPYPARKDETDLELALKEALDRKVSEIIILGALGKRWDMTLSNVLVLTAPFLKGVKTRILEDRQEITCLRGGQKAAFNGRAGDVLSLSSLQDSAGGITLNGLEFPLKNATLPLGSTRGISNVFAGNTAEIEIRTGYLLVFITHLPEND